MWEGINLTLVDTAGFLLKRVPCLRWRPENRILLALEQADIILFLVDGKSGLHPEDAVLMDVVRRTGNRCFSL